MDAIFGPLADAVGASVDQIKLISCLLLSYPLGSLFVRIPVTQPALKHAFNIGVSAFYLMPMLNLYGGSLQLLGSTMATYYIAKYNTSPNMPWIVFAVVMAHLTFNHVARAIFELGYETFEVTGPQMVLVMKLSTFAWNVYDGRRDASKLDKWQTAFRVVEYPSILEFLGYAFYFPGMLIGPFLEFGAYRSLVDGSVFQSIERKDNAAKLRTNSTMPVGRKRVGYVKMAFGLFYLGLYVVFYGSYNFSVALQPSFATKSLLTRIALFQFYGIFERCKYYAIWTLTEGAAVITGLGFTGYSATGASKWDGAANINVANIELGENFKMILDNWNMKTNQWLRECIYKRITPEGQKPGFSSTMITFLTSAFWHGIAGGYYIAFAFAGFIQIAMRLCRSNFRPLFLTVPASPAFTAGTKDTPASYRVTQAQPTALKPVYDVASIFVSVLVLNYTAAPFMLLSIKDSLLVWGRLGWYGQVLVFGALAFFWSGGGRLLRSKNVNKAVVQGEKVAGKVGEQVGQNITVAKGKVGEVVDQVANGNGVASEVARTLKAQ